MRVDSDEGAGQPSRTLCQHAMIFKIYTDANGCLAEQPVEIVSPDDGILSPSKHRAMAAELSKARAAAERHSVAADQARNAHLAAQQAARRQSQLNGGTQSRRGARQTALAADAVEIKRTAWDTESALLKMLGDAVHSMANDSIQKVHEHGRVQRVAAVQPRSERESTDGTRRLFSSRPRSALLQRATSAYLHKQSSRGMLHMPQRALSASLVRFGSSSREPNFHVRGAGQRNVHRARISLASAASAPGWRPPQADTQPGNIDVGPHVPQGAATRRPQSSPSASSRDRETRRLAAIKARGEFRAADRGQMPAGRPASAKCQTHGYSSATASRRPSRPSSATLMSGRPGQALSSGDMLQAGDREAHTIEASGGDNDARNARDRAAAYVVSRQVARPQQHPRARRALHLTDETSAASNAEHQASTATSEARSDQEEAEKAVLKAPESSAQAEKVLIARAVALEKAEQRRIQGEAKAIHLVAEKLARKSQERVELATAAKLVRDAAAEETKKVAAKAKSDAIVLDASKQLVRSVMRSVRQTMELQAPPRATAEGDTAVKKYYA